MIIFSDMASLLHISAITFWVPIGIALLAAILSFTEIARSDRPTKNSQWISSLAAALFFGASVGCATWVVALLLTAPGLLGVLLVAGYLLIGAMYATWELRQFHERPVAALLSALITWIAWPLIACLLWRVLGEDDACDEGRGSDMSG